MQKKTSQGSARFCATPEVLGRDRKVSVLRCLVAIPVVVFLSATEVVAVSAVLVGRLPESEVRGPSCFLPELSIGLCRF